MRTSCFIHTLPPLPNRMMDKNDGNLRAELLKLLIDVLNQFKAGMREHTTVIRSLAERIFRSDLSIDSINSSLVFTLPKDIFTIVRLVADSNTNVSFQKSEENNQATHREPVVWN
jgi:hypothetical protein